MQYWRLSLELIHIGTVPTLAAESSAVGSIDAEWYMDWSKGTAKRGVLPSSRASASAPIRAARDSSLRSDKVAEGASRAVSMASSFMAAERRSSPVDVTPPR